MDGETWGGQTWGGQTWGGETPRRRLRAYADADLRGFDTYLASLVGSWRAMAVPQPRAAVLTGDGFVAARFPPQPIFDNAVLLKGDALPAARAVYVGLARYAVWTATEATARAVQAAGFVPDEVTHPMVCDLSRWDAPGAPAAAEGPTVRAGADPGLIAELNGVPQSLLDGVPGLRCYATEDESAGAVLIEVGDDVNVSFVATRPPARRRGLAGAVLARALADARADGFTTSSLQATAMALGVYRRLGYRQVATWQEWLPPS